jgi:hypothetical protein
VALQPNSFLASGGGELIPDVMPGVTTEAVTAWLTVAQEQATDERHVRALVYAAAYQVVVNHIMSQLASERKADVQGARSDEQFRYWQKRLAYWQHKVDAFSGTMNRYGTSIPTRVTL